MSNQDVVDLMNEAQRLRDTIDLLERNARIQARLLADTARERDHALGLVESARGYVERAIASYAGDPADNNFQKGFLAALEVVRDEAFGSPHTPQVSPSGAGAK